MNQTSDERIRKLIEAPVFPHEFAMRCSSRWKPYNYLKKISLMLAKAIGKGGGRLIFSCPPRHGKSQLISHYTPAWFLSIYPSESVIISSYGAELATHWGRSVRNTLTRNIDIGVELAKDSKAANRFNTSHGGSLTTSGVGGSLTGKGAGLIIVDDPVKDWQDAKSPTKQKTTIDWFNSTLYTRAEPSSTIIVLQTRWDENDLAGYLMAEHGDDWSVINFPALAEEADPLGRKPGEALCPERFNVDELLKIKQAVGSQVWNALYQGNPLPSEGVKFKKDWIRYYKRAELLEPDGKMKRMDMISISGDFTFDEGEANDYNVLQVWGILGAKTYLLAQLREKAAFIRQKAMLDSYTKERWRNYTALLIEKKANGAALIDTIKPYTHGIIEIEPTESKEVRADFVTPAWEAGDVLLPDPSEEPWVEDFIQEILKFPNAKHDDQVDAMTQFLRWKAQMREPRIRVLG